MSKNTESIDITKVTYHIYTINNTKLSLSNRNHALITNKGLLRIKYSNYKLISLVVPFFLF